MILLVTLLLLLSLITLKKCNNMARVAPGGGGGSSSSINTTLPISQGTRAAIWAALIASEASSVAWSAILNQIPQNYITPFSSASQYLSMPSWSSISDRNPDKVRVYATDQALVATYLAQQKNQPPPSIPPGGLGPGQGGDIGGANPGFGVSGPWWLDFKRIVEFVVGAVVIGMGINVIVKKQGGGAKRTSMVPKALKFTPAGRVTSRRTSSGRTRYQGQNYATFRE